MILEDLLARLLQLTGTLDLRIVAFLFVICTIGEFGLTIPYLMESVWLMAGYQIGAGTLPAFYLLGFWLAAQLGRQAGAIALYHVARAGSTPLVSFYNRHRNSRLVAMISSNYRVLKHVKFSSPFSVAYGRLLWLRIPLTVTSAFRKDLASLIWGVLLSGTMWDATYIVIGAVVGRTTAFKPLEMLLASLAGLTFLYLLVFGLRRLIVRWKPTTA
ncbi:MAG: hypothetical protein V1691_00685 [Chloroflexota bacterium]